MTYKDFEETKWNLMASPAHFEDLKNYHLCITNSCLL